MKKDIALNIIKEIENNPNIHYIELKDKVKEYLSENELYMLLVALTNPPDKEIVKYTETTRYHECSRGARSIEKSTFKLVCDKNNLIEKLETQLNFWKLNK